MIESLLWGPSLVAVVAGMGGRPQQWVGIKDGLKRWQLSGELSAAGDERRWAAAVVTWS